jgi:hypothetical protein
MPAFTDNEAGFVLDFVTGRVTPHHTAVRTLYLGLLTAAPTGTNPTLASLTEVIATGYARQAVTWAAPTTTAGVTTTANSANVLFGPFTAIGGLPACTYAFLCTVVSGTAGEVQEIFQLPSALTALQGESAQAAIGALTLNLY